MISNRIIMILFCLIFGSCSEMKRERIVDKSELTGDDYRLFQNTPAWKLAKAVWDEDVASINKIVLADKEIINYKESIYGRTLLFLTISK